MQASRVEDDPQGLTLQLRTQVEVVWAFPCPYYACATLINNCSTLVNLCWRMQAGTYIKEFVHGDSGRTSPSLGSLLGCRDPAEILELDVLDIHMEFLPD